MFYVTVIYFSLFLIYKTYICHAFETDEADTCKIIRDQFAVATSEFTSCSIKNSRPITLCENCIHSYIQVLNSYSNMSKKSDNGTTCLDHFVNLDRLQIVETQYSNSVNLWNRGKCYECYVTENGIPSYTVSNKTDTFLKYYNSYQSCINKSIDDKNLCHNCMDYYVTLHDYYFSISNSNERISLCIDLVDIMNTTWTYWSKNCCIYRKHNEYIFIGSIVGVFFFTIFFYVIVKFSTEKLEPTIVPQTRLAESVSNIRN